TSSAPVAGIDVNDKPGAPSITSITDVDACAQNGIHVNYSAGSPAGTSYNLYKDGISVVTGYVSGAIYDPTDTARHNYRIVSVKNTCSTSSAPALGIDVNDKPGAPSITSITDVDACAQSGIHVNYSAGSPAGSSYDLYKDGNLVVAGYVSGAVYNPADTASH